MLERIPFRFLDLPKELRFIVYENLELSATKVRLPPLAKGAQLSQHTQKSLDNQSTVTVTLQTLPVQIFLTCRLIYSEALPFLTRKLHKLRETIPRITIDADGLYTNALHTLQKLLCTLLDTLNAHPLVTPSSTPLLPHPNCATPPNPYPKEIHHWLAQTTHLLLSQSPPPCPLSGFMGTITHPTVRLIIEVPQVWKYTTYTMSLLASPPIYTSSVASQLSQLYSELVDYTRGLGRVKSAAIVFGQEEGRMLGKEGLVVTKTVALDFGVRRAGG